jgi:uncharacterized UBP type Zn finger protein
MTSETCDARNVTVSHYYCSVSSRDADDDTRKFYSLTDWFGRELPGTRVRVKYAFGSVPDYLIVHLKRFRPVATGYVKVTDSIDLAASQVLDVSEWCTDETALPQLDQSMGETESSAKTKRAEWACPRCTLLNKLSRSDCEACQQERPPLDSFGNPIPPQISELNGRQYRLKAVVRHLGSFAFAGHYVCDVEQGDGWVRYDDSTARKVKWVFMLG